jgi:hypothetical protein
MRRESKFPTSTNHSRSKLEKELAKANNEIASTKDRLRQVRKATKGRENADIALDIEVCPSIHNPWRTLLKNSFDWKQKLPEPNDIC